MKVGDLVSGRGIEFGRITHAYPDGKITIEVLFSSFTMHGVSSAEFTIKTEESLSRYEAAIKEQKRIDLIKSQQEQSQIEADRLAKIKKEEQRKHTLSKIKLILAEDFLGADRFYKENCVRFLSNEDYRKEKIEFVQKWFKKYESRNMPDYQQAAAIASVNNNIQVIARAGSGKTETIVNRAFFLQQHCGISPQEILLLAFNKKAVEKMENDLRSMAEDRIPHILTFHALAYNLIHPGEELLYDDPRSEHQGLSQTIQDIIDDHLRSEQFYKRIRQLMLAQFRDDWELIVAGGYDMKPEDLLKYRRSLPRKSLKGEDVKSYGEKVIADFLFENDVPYLYERSFESGKKNLRPDFTILKSDNCGVVIEYFGLAGDLDYDEQSDWKRGYWGEKPEWTFLEFTPEHIKQSGVQKFREMLKTTLEKECIPCNQLSEEEIWNRVNENGRAISTFTKAIVTFIGKCRKLGLTPDTLADRIDRHVPQFKTEGLFVEIAKIFYCAYVERLTKVGEEDFDGLMQRAIKAIYDGGTIFERRNDKGDLKTLRYIFIDEYQDFSNLFHKLTESIRVQNPHVLFFCVGDNWQAINGFAGSDLKYFNNFNNYFKASQQLDVSTNYRSDKTIVDIGNALMLGHGKPAIAFNKSKGRVLLADIDDFKSSAWEKELHHFDKLTPMVLRLVAKETSSGRNVTLLSRTNHIRYDNLRGKEAHSGIKGYLKQLREYLPRQMRHRLSSDTAHKYKGLQDKVVIILDAVDRCYPLIHPLWFLFRILGDNKENIISEERRLFYVALTRAAEALIIVTERRKCSPFLEELIGKSEITKINWDIFPQVRSGENRLLVKVNNNNNIEIKELLNAGGFKYHSEPEYAWIKSYPRNGFSIDNLKNLPWAKAAKDIIVTIMNDQEKADVLYNVSNGNWICIVR